MSAPRHWKTPPKTPWNPSRKATARVTNPLPVPTECPHCGECCGIVNNSEIYGREYGEWPWAVLCAGCGAYVGLHPFTGIPLGTLATAPIRKARSAAKAVFNPIWQSGQLSRSEAYAWLAKAMGIANVEECHIGWFGVEQCEKVIRFCARHPNGALLYSLTTFREDGVPIMLDESGRRSIFCDVDM